MMCESEVHGYECTQRMLVFLEKIICVSNQGTSFLSVCFFICHQLLSKLVLYYVFHINNDILYTS